MHTKHAPAPRQIQPQVLAVVQLAVEPPGDALILGHFPRALRLVEEDGELQRLWFVCLFVFVWSGV